MERRRIAVDNTAVAEEVDKRELATNETVTEDGFIRDREVEPARYPESEVRECVDWYVLTLTHLIRFSSCTFAVLFGRLL